jgi:hypothetical protein
VAMNKLNLLDYEDMRRISKALERFIRW